MSMVRRSCLLLLALLALVSGVSAIDGPLTPLFQLRGRTDENGYLLISAGTPGGIDGPLTILSSLRGRTDGNGYLRVACSDCSGSSGAPTDATYITQTANGSLSAEQALGALATGLMFSTTTTGAVTTRAPTNDNIVIGSGTDWVLTAFTSCSAATSAVTYNTTTNALGCNTTTPTDATFITQTASSGLSAEQAIGALSSGILRGATTTGVITSLGDILPMANGGLAVALVDPDADRILFWDDSAGNYAYLTIGANLTITGTTLDAAGGGGGGGAPDDATYLTQTSNAGLSAEQALASLSSGIMRVATTTGVVTSLGDILPGANGGTANGFFAVTGPTTSLKTFTFPNASSTIATTAGTETFTNKRITKRVTTAADATSITPNSDSADITYQLNAQSTGTLTINADGGTPTNGQQWVLKIKSTNVQTFSWNGVFVGGSIALPTVTTAGSKIDYFSFIYDSVNSKWHFVAYAMNY